MLNVNSSLSQNCGGWAYAVWNIYSLSLQFPRDDFNHEGLAPSCLRILVDDGWGFALSEEMQVDVT